MPGAMVHIKTKIFAAEVNEALKAHMTRNVFRAVEYARGRVVENLSDSFKSQGASEPGDYPHARTGLLRQSIRGNVDANMVGTVGTNVEYALWLEIGTSIMEPRPFLLRTVVEESHKIMMLLGKPMK